MKKLLIIVDYQNDFISGTLGFPEAKELAPKIEERILSYLNEGNDIIFTLDTHSENYLSTLEGKVLPISHCIEGEIGHEVYITLKKYLPQAKKVFKKETFPSLEMANYLKENPYDEVELCGLVSNICVLTNAVMVRSALPNAHIYLNENLTSSSNKKLQEEGFDVLKGIFIDVYK